MEDADFRAAQELFGGQDLDKMQPKSAKDFEDFAATLAHKYVLGHAKSAHYKNLVKALFKVSSGTTDILSRLGMLTKSVILEHNGPNACKRVPQHAQSVLCKTLDDGRPFPCLLEYYPGAVPAVSFIALCGC